MRTPIQSMYERFKISPNSETWKWTLLESFVYYKWIKWSNDYIVIPAWFEFDWASVPRAFWCFGHPMEIDTLIWACVHDRLYHLIRLNQKNYTREQADNKFNEVMLVCEVRTVKRVVFFLAVRAFGWLSTKSCKIK